MKRQLEKDFLLQRQDDISSCCNVDRSGARLRRLAHFMHFKGEPRPLAFPRSMLSASHRRLRLITISMSIMHFFLNVRAQRPRGRRTNRAVHVLEDFIFFTYSYNQSDTEMGEIKQSRRV